MKSGIPERKFLVAAAIWITAALQGAFPARADRLKVAYPTTVGSMAVVWVAKEARLFEKHGLDVELIYVAGSSKVVQAMLAREVPIAEIAIPAVIQSNLAGADLVMLAGPNHKPGQKIMVKPEIRRPEDLKGRRIGVTRFGTSDDFLLRYILGRWGLQPDREVALIQMGGSQETLAGLGSRAIDGGMLSSPLHLRAAKLGFSMLADLSAIGVDYQGAGVVTTRGYARENPNVLRRYLRAYVEALHRFKTDKEFSVKVIGKYSRITEPDALEETYRHYAVKVMPRVPYPTLPGIQLVLDEIASRNPKAKAVTPASLIDVSYLQELEQGGFVKSLYGR
ncbi:MAG TPA: ABC transporter substrate-binding protein [candidate division Zixibacteria bacterium]|nr:ABC transporter substrate-binding protein [candidate division Zixibacteria bacterium]